MSLQRREDIKNGRELIEVLFTTDICFILKTGKKVQEEITKNLY